MGVVVVMAVALLLLLSPLHRCHRSCGIVIVVGVAGIVVVMIAVVRVCLYLFMFSICVVTRGDDS
jgi:hypothetical protein